MNNSYIKITSGNATVYASGSVTSFDEKPITIEFGIPSDPLKLTLDFKKDATGQIKINAQDIDKNSLKLEITNIVSSLGGGTLSPIPIGDFEGKKLYINFLASSLNNSNQVTLLYTIYMI
jgi:hypothetical protein